MGFRRDDRQLFDRAAADYEAARPRYPERVVTEMVDRAQVAPSGRILEIGCGTGQLTVPLAARGYAITAIELGERLACLAAVNLASAPNAEVICANFETWPVESAAYDLVVSAQAFHWIDPAIGYPKIHAALRPSGQLALLWNLFPGCSDPVHRALDEVYRSFAPQLVRDAADASLEARVERTLREIRNSALFGEPDLVRSPWVSTYSTARYLRLLRTHSDHLALDPATLDELLMLVRSTIDRYGGVLERPLIATLFMARPRLG